MAYKDRYGITKIIDSDVDNLSISMDEIHRIGLESKDGEIGPVFLYTPDMSDKKNHYHISLNLQEAKLLRDWLNNLLADPNLSERFNKDLMKK